ncbi:hypothetical protein HK096_001100, partial [Nowakowskiella sp. JEL0078]
LPPTVTAKQKIFKVLELAKQFHLVECFDTIIRSSEADESKISGGQLRRLTIALHLIRSTPIILL